MKSDPRLTQVRTVAKRLERAEVGAEALREERLDLCQALLDDGVQAAVVAQAAGFGARTSVYRALTRRDRARQALSLDAPL